MLKYFLNISEDNIAKDIHLIKKLGKGSFGEVYLSLNKKSQKLMAIKIEVN